MKSNRTLKPMLLTSLIVIGVILIVGGCGKDTPNANDVNTKILSSHGWKLQTLSVDGVDKTDLYSGMTLSFTAGSAYTYTSSHGAPVWPTSGTWSLSADGKTVQRDDQVTVNVDEIADGKLVLSLTWNKTTYGGGRGTSVSGNHVFTFVK
jgi:hypothetical protein